MINFNNPPKQFKISEQSYNIQVGDKVRCYDADTNNLNHFVGYATVTEIIDADINFFWCKAKATQGQSNIDYAYYCIPTLTIKEELLNISLEIFHDECGDK